MIKKKREIIVDNKKIKEGSNFKMLGLIIDFQLKFESHCNKIIAKSRRVLGAIKRLSPLISTKAATKILKKLSHWKSNVWRIVLFKQKETSKPN